MKTITILGATGSIGTSTLDLVERSPEQFRVLALTANADVPRLAAAAIRTRAARAVIADEACLPALRDALAGTGIEAAGGASAVTEAAAMGADVTVAAIVGCAGLRPAMAAVEQGGTLALANKEALVSAGDVMNAAVARHGATLLPVDSEHSAIFQCLDATLANRVSRIILTASGGPFIAIISRRPSLGKGVVYCGLPVLALVFLRRQDDGLLFAFWALALVWATDIGAFFAGRSIGGPKLAPRLSPNKTWAGLIGGVIAAGGLGLILHVRFGLPLHMTISTPLLAVLAQGGDLYESWLKRQAGVKDSGNILPGHGGVLDRLDGLVPVAPVAALLVVAPYLSS